MRKWLEKPYHSLDYMLQERFKEKVYKITLNGGMSCPNRDGTLGNRGCIFCSAGGSGDFAGNSRDSITTQIKIQADRLREKRGAKKFIAYFQAYTNTYAPVDYLEKIFTEALSYPDSVEKNPTHYSAFPDFPTFPEKLICQHHVFLNIPCF